MRKIVAGLFISLDGVVEAPDAWHFPYFNEEMGEAVGSQMAESDAMLLGRQTYQEFAAFWPNQEETEMEPAGYMNNTPKYVVSTTLDSAADWANSTLIKGDVVNEITKLKQRPGKNISVVGSGTLVRSLLRGGLLDELRLLVHPIVVGTGKRLFDSPSGAAGRPTPTDASTRADSERVPLKLINATTFGTGVLALTYGPADT